MQVLKMVMTCGERMKAVNSRNWLCSHTTAETACTHGFGGVEQGGIVFRKTGPSVRAEVSETILRSGGRHCPPYKIKLPTRVCEEFYRVSCQTHPTYMRGGTNNTRIRLVQAID